MDAAAVSFVTNECLEELGLKAKGDTCIFALKAFSQRQTMPTTIGSKNMSVKTTDYEDRKRQLLEQLEIGKQKKKAKNNEKSSYSSSTTVKTSGERWKTRKISLGWLNFSKVQNRFVPVRQMNGGGSRRLSVASASSKETLIEEGKKLFFPDGMSPQGNAIDFIFDLANFKGATIENEINNEENSVPFTIQRYIEKNKLSQVRLYLTTRPFLSSEEEDPESDNLDSEPEDDEIKYMSTCARKETERKTEAKLESDDDDLMFSIYDDDTTQLIGSSEERQKIREEQNQLFQKSLNEDRRKEIEKREAREKEENEKMRLEQVRLTRLNRLPPQPDHGLPQVKIAVKHIAMGKIVRSFSIKESMLAVYDWVGSLAPLPENFRLCQCQGQAIPPTDSVQSVSNCTLYMEASEDPIPFCSEDPEVIFKGFAGTSEVSSNDDTLPSLPSSSTAMITSEPPKVLMEEDRTLTEDEKTHSRFYDELKEKRRREFDTFVDVKNVCISKENIVKELIELYKDESVTKSELVMQFTDAEDTVGSGVLREAYSLFWNDLMANNTTGETEFTIPLTPHLSCDDYVSIGRIITHQFVQCSTFPVRISQASIQQAVLGEVTTECLVSSFTKLLPPRERDIIQSGLRNVKPFPQGEIIEILEDFNIRMAPSPANLSTLLTQIARNEFVQKPYLCLLNIRKGMGSFWDDVTVGEISSIYNLCQPTVRRVIDHLYMNPKDPKDDQIYRWLQRYIRICGDEALVKFVRFCTATDIIRPNCRIAVETQLMAPSAIRPK